MVFQIGDRVEAVVDHPDDNECLICGDQGTVRDIDSNIGVEWDKFCYGHNLRGNAQDGHGWWVRPSDIRLSLEEQLEDFPEFSADDIFNLFFEEESK